MQSYYLQKLKPRRVKNKNIIAPPTQHRRHSWALDFFHGINLQYTTNSGGMNSLFVIKEKLGILYKSLFSKSLKICQSTFRSRFFKVCTIDNLVHYSSFPYLILRFKIYNYILISLAAENQVLKNNNNRGQVLNGLFFLSNDSFYFIPFYYLATYMLILSIYFVSLCDGQMTC